MYERILQLYAAEKLKKKDYVDIKILLSNL